MRKLLPYVAATLMLLTACSGGSGPTPETTADTQVKPGQAGTLTEEDAKIFADTCQTLAKLETELEDGFADPAEMKTKIAASVEASKRSDDENVKAKLAALGAFESYEDSGFSEAYSAARQACAAWGAELGGTTPPSSNPGNQVSEEDNAVKIAHGKTCAVVFEAIRGYQDGSFTIEETEAKVKSIEEHISGLNNPAAEKALQDLVTWVDTDKGSLPDLMNAVVSGCSTVSGNANGPAGG